MKKTMARSGAFVIVLSLLLGLLSGCAAARAAAPEDADAPPEPRNVKEDLLLLVDFQNVYMPGQEWACPSMPETIKNTIRILDAENAPDVVMTRFIAPQEPTGRWAVYNEAYREINGNEFLGEFVPELEPYARRVTVVEKSTYSSVNEEVLSALEGKKAVVMAGVVADCCILATMYDAMDLGYEVVYLYDCIAGVSEESEAEIRALAEIFSPIHTTVMSSEEYLAAISGG